MNIAQAMAAMSARTEKVAAAGKVVDPEALQRAANTAAGKVRKMAFAAGHSVGIKVSARANGVRVSVTGPKAHRYRAILTSELNRIQPETAADIKAQITRKIR